MATSKKGPNTRWAPALKLVWKATAKPASIASSIAVFKKEPPIHSATGPNSRTAGLYSTATQFPGHEAGVYVKLFIG